MNLLFKSFSILALSLGIITAFAAKPEYLKTDNTTNVESNAFIGGVPSIYPTPANSKKQVYWNLVRLACFQHTTDNGKICPAVIKMATNTAKPIELGKVTLNLETGEINPKYLSNNGYALIVNGPGDTTLIKN
jgi:hypothetical protein